MSQESQRDPYKTMCVVKHNGKEVGRVPACAKNAPDYVNGLASHYGSITVDYVDDENASLMAELHGGLVVLPKIR